MLRRGRLLLGDPGRLYCRTVVDGSPYNTPVFILHGLFGSQSNWTSISHALSSKSDRPVYAIDLRNHGRSPHWPTMSFAEMAADLHLIIQDKAHGASPILLGHSLGGKVAMTYSLRYPGWPSALIVVDMAPVPYPGMGEIQGYIQTLLGIPVHTMATREEAIPHLAAIPEPDARSLILHNIVPRPAGGVQWRFNLEAIAAALPQLAGFDASPPPAEDLPTLFIKGQRSSYIVPDYYHAMEHLFPGHEMATLWDAGHWVHRDQPQQFVDTCTDFIQRHFPDDFA